MSIDPKVTKRRQKVRQYAKYSGIAYQLFGLVALGVFVGLKADKYFGFRNNYITAFLVIILFSAYMYKLCITILRENK